jgi:hypothetical protein
VSADSYGVCPRCAFGIEGEEEREKFRTFREDWELGVDSAKTARGKEQVYITFNGECHVCHLKISIDENYAIPGWPR